MIAARSETTATALVGRPSFRSQTAARPLDQLNFLSSANYANLPASYQTSIDNWISAKQSSNLLAQPEPDSFEDWPPAPPQTKTTQLVSVVEGGDTNRETSHLLAEWHGQVTEILADVFKAELRGTHGLGVVGKLEEALIPTDDVQPADVDLFVDGAFFRLCISYEVSATGVRRRCTTVVFRRLPAYRREELEDARRVGQEIARGLRLE